MISHGFRMGESVLPMISHRFRMGESALPMISHRFHMGVGHAGKAPTPKFKMGSVLSGACEIAERASLTDYQIRARTRQRASA